MVAAMNTGCREDELMSLQWQDVREAAITLPAEKTKARRSRTIRINAALRDVLDRRRNGPDDQVLGPGCYVFGTETGASLHEVRAALGHANLTMTSVYLNSTAERQQQNVDRLPAPRRAKAGMIIRKVSKRLSTPTGSAACDREIR